MIRQELWRSFPQTSGFLQGIIAEAEQDPYGGRNAPELLALSDPAVETDRDCLVTVAEVATGEEVESGKGK